MHSFTYLFILTAFL